MKGFVSFDRVWPSVQDVLARSGLAEAGLRELYALRDLTGRVRLVIPEGVQMPAQMETALREVVERLEAALGAHAYPSDRAVLRAAPEELDALREGALRVPLGDLVVYMADRLLTGMGWRTVRPGLPQAPRRFTLFSLKGGVGRSTTAAVLASHLAGKGLKVLVVDLDLESPGVSSMVLAPEEHPDYGVADWFVEDLVGQGDEVLLRMVGRPRWRQELPGDILVAPAYGADPGDYLSKLGRVYLDRSPESPDASPERWSSRLLRMLDALESHHKPDAVVLDSRNGLHDLAAAAVTDVRAHVLLFAVDSEATWAGYKVLFKHWADYGAATSIRTRLSLVASLVPVERESLLLKRMRERAWDLFREYLYDDVPPDPGEAARSEVFSFDLADDEAPHSPWPIYWHTALAWVPSVRGLEEGAIPAAYREFLKRFDEHFGELLENAREGAP